jgi:hypothetical protein
MTYIVTCFKTKKTNVSSSLVSLVQEKLKVNYSLFIIHPFVASKIFMQFIASASKSSGEVERVKNQLLDSNPVLEGKIKLRKRD